ncbi:hypothetical protein TNCV_2248361 [Trichonephila clavipes]|nr:hypothetical protein TNCV_2248361 [Trichonephila clavipes]
MKELLIQIEEKSRERFKVFIRILEISCGTLQEYKCYCFLPRGKKSWILERSERFNLSQKMNERNDEKISGRSGTITLQSSPIGCDTTLNRGIGGWVSLAAHVMGALISDILQPGALRWFGKTQKPVVKVLPLSGLSS